MNYDFKNIEKKWQKIWEEKPIAETKPTGSGKKYYCLDMFPYPSGSGLHVGHWRGYVLSDVYARIKWLQNYNVLHPMGWDAFGLPAENDAIKKGIDPAVNTAKNIANFKKQLKEVAAIYDWSKEINTTDPQYYKWTQWIFLQMFKAGLAYESNLPINWCPSCLTGLANEEVVAGTCDRCGTKVEHKNIRQWVLKITEYAEKLLEGLNRLDWPEKVKLMQQNWIGKSEGAEIIFKVHALDNTWIDVAVFTTRPDTIYGVTFLAIAPDHELLKKLVDTNQNLAIKKYQEQFDSMTGTDRLASMEEKTGIFSGTYALHPLTFEKVPIYLANYVLKNYGTGVVMGVPAHCERDFDFAKKYGIKAKQVIESPNIEKDSFGNILKAYEGDGTLINSGCFSGIEALISGKEEIIKEFEKTGLGNRKVTYKLRDWIFSRQRYWGEPIPLIHCKVCGVVPVPEDQLPVELPKVEKYQPTGTGESPLAAVESWVNVKCPQCNSDAKRETNTMPQWAGSSWYFLRYPNPNLKDNPFDQQDMKYWMPVDLYVGGIEHAILHLLYARFYVKVLYDLGYLSFDEPFKQLFNQGMVNKLSQQTGKVEKMSKSKGNVVNPDDIVQSYGSDALRMYILFMGPPELDCEWQDSGLEGIKRFLNRLWLFLTDKNVITDQESSQATKLVHKFIKEFQERIDLFKPNTALSAFMEFLNESQSKSLSFSKENIEKICIILSSMAPHMASELLELIFKKDLSNCKWPTYDDKLAADTELSIPIQVNGRLRGSIVVPVGSDEALIDSKSRAEIAKWLENKQIIKVIYVKDRLINYIVK